ncbi:MAG: hypothetical protein AAGD47_01875 [Pseudomonadota bacterium]
MSEIFSAEELRDRARDLEDLNGFDLVFVELDDSVDPPVANLTVEFLNDVAVAEILADLGGSPTVSEIYQTFRISGGRRIVGGDLPGQVQVTAVTGVSATSLELTVEPIGDYSTYRLECRRADFDPIFAEIPFKFRPGCFNLNCHPREAPPEPLTNPRIDYEARDYASFKHLLLNLMRDRVPEWEPTSEADLDQVIINLLAAKGDELADKQDRIANEAFFPRARKRVSLARHARLMDYHIHEGNQASTVLAVEVTGDPGLGPAFAAWTGRGAATEGEIFLHDMRDLDEDATERPVFETLNRMALYTWQGLVGALEAGATGADITLPGTTMDETQSETLRDAINLDLAGPVLLEEILNPETGRAPGRDPRQRQLLRVLPDAENRFDPVATAWYVRINWRPEDALTRRYCFVTRCPDQPTEEQVSLFFGNVVPVSHGAPNLTLFTDPDRPLDAALAADQDTERTEFLADHPTGRITEANYEETKWGRLCALPEGPVAYRDTRPGGEDPVRSSLSVSVDGIAEWEEQSDLTQSLENAEHFLVETDETARSRIRFGNGVNGAAPPPGTWVSARYQVGVGTAGNVGSDRIASYDRARFAAVDRVWNPFDVTNGRSAETADVIRRRVPEAYRARQLRAITLNDYKRRAEELPFVQNAAAAYGWTGSWRTVRLTLDPFGRTDLLPEQVTEAQAYLNPIRLIGEDLEIRPPDLLPLDIILIVCAHPRFWPEDLEADLDEAFSEGYTSGGERGFFHPDNWTFGQKLHASQIIGRALEVEGVDRVLELGMAPWDRAGGPSLETIVLQPSDIEPPPALTICPAANQIIRVANDPSALELGRIEICVEGGRQ